MITQWLFTAYALSIAFTISASELLITDTNTASILEIKAEEVLIINFSSNIDATFLSQDESTKVALQVSPRPSLIAGPAELHFQTNRTMVLVNDRLRSSNVFTRLTSVLTPAQVDIPEGQVFRMLPPLYQDGPNAVGGAPYLVDIEANGKRISKV